MVEEQSMHVVEEKNVGYLTDSKLTMKETQKVKTQCLPQELCASCVCSAFMD